jgi:archaemetzincin
MRSIIQVAPLHKPAEGAARHVVHRLPDIFGFPAEIVTPIVDLKKAFNPQRRQYHSGIILAGLLEYATPPGAKVIGITDADLYIPVLTFVFGEAQLGGRAAVASLYRLRNSFYGLPMDEELLLARIEKEVVHELGHTFGLRHCESYACVMHSSTFVEDIDLKNAAFCRECRKRITR